MSSITLVEAISPSFLVTDLLWRRPWILDLQITLQKKLKILHLRIQINTELEKRRKSSGSINRSRRIPQASSMSLNIISSPNSCQKDDVFPFSKAKFELFVQFWSHNVKDILQFHNFKNYLIRKIWFLIWVQKYPDGGSTGTKISKIQHF